MADQKLSSLTALAAEPAPTDQLYVNDGGVSKRIAWSVIDALFATSAQGSTADTALQDVVDDTTPQLGGSLDVNGQKIVSVANGNIDIEPNGTGNVLLGNFTIDADATVGAGQDNYVWTYDHGTGLMGLEAAAGGGLTNWQESGTTLQPTTAGYDFGSATNEIGDLYMADSKSLILGSAQDLKLTRDAANVLAQRNSTNAQTFNIYNLYSDASNYERGFLKWNSNVLEIGTEKAGTGSNRNSAVRLPGAASGSKVSILDSAGQEQAYFNDWGSLLVESSIYVSSTSYKLAASSSKWEMRSGSGASFYHESDVASGNVYTFGNWGYQLTAASGVQNFFVVAPDIQQSSTAGYTGILLNVAETATGSGAKRLLDLQVASTSKAYVDNAGQTVAQYFQAAQAFTVATLPATPAVGMMARVTDATAPAVGVTVVGGGAAAALVWYNGANWTVIGV